MLVDLLLRDPVGNINALNDEDMTALDIASAAAQRNPNCAYIARKLEAAGAFRSSFIPKSNKSDTSNDLEQGIDKDTGDALTSEGMSAVDIIAAAVQYNPNCAEIVDIPEGAEAVRSSPISISAPMNDLAQEINKNTVNDQNDENQNTGNATAARHNLSCAEIVEIADCAGAIRSSRINHMGQGTDKDTVNTHMIVASLIATVTFAAIFPIPGGFEDDKGSIHYGAAKMAFRKLFRCFILCDTAAFTTSVTVVAAWLVRQQLPGNHFQGKVLPHLSGTCLPVSIVWTIAAFVTAAIIVIIPPGYDKLKTRDKEAFSKYKLCMEIEIYIAIVAPVVGSSFLYLLIMHREKWFSKYVRKIIPIYLYALMFLVTCLIIIATVK
ncbi:hypothetical protein SUGI_0179790 [Cryptomeria japonica]|nr:hypothetical protein SUGI_0179790 [Cryptomeria japonica]